MELSAYDAWFKEAVNCGEKLLGVSWVALNNVGEMNCASFRDLEQAFWCPRLVCEQLNQRFCIYMITHALLHLFFIIQNSTWTQSRKS